MPSERLFKRLLLVLRYELPPIDGFNIISDYSEYIVVYRSVSSIKQHPKVVFCLF